MKNLIFRIQNRIHVDGEESSLYKREVTNIKTAFVWCPANIRCRGDVFFMMKEEPTRLIFLGRQGGHSSAITFKRPMPSLTFF